MGPILLKREDVEKAEFVVSMALNQFQNVPFGPYEKPKEGVDSVPEERTWVLELTLLHIRALQAMGDTQAAIQIKREARSKAAQVGLWDYVRKLDMMP